MFYRIASNASMKYLPSRYYFAKTSQSQKTIIELKEKILSQQPDIENIAELEYKQYPYHISHYDPEHPDYIPSWRADYYARIKTDSHNYLLDRLKSDLKMQKQVDDMITKLDRPYLRGKPGVTQNVTGGLREYFPIDAGFKQQKGDEQYEDEVKYHPVFRNEKRWLAQSIFTNKRPMLSNESEFERLKEQRTVTDHFHEEKGSKFDVEIPYYERYPYLADRLGHPEFVASPIQRFFRLESDLYHPVFTDQPFVQKPSISADPTLNFEEGEVIYENTRLLEWIRLWLYSSWAGYMWMNIFVPYQLIYKTHIPADSGLEGNYFGFYQHSIYNFDYFKMHIPAYFLALFYTSLALLRLSHKISSQYIIKAQYSKDRELIFITKAGMMGGIEQEIFETSHIEFVPFGSPSMHQFSPDQDEDGMYSAFCLNTQRRFQFYKDHKFWNPKLRTQFIVNHSQLVTKEQYGMKRIEKEQWDREYQDSLMLEPSQLPRQQRP